MSLCPTLTPLCKVVESGLRQDRLDSRIVNQGFLTTGALWATPRLQKSEGKS